MKKIFTLLLSLMLFTAIQAQTVYEIIQNSPNHTILETAIDAAELGATLSAPGTFTVFAPDDDAFMALGQATIDALLAEPSGQLTQILLYHVLGSTVLSSNLENGLQAGTVQSGLVTVIINGDGAYINQALVSMPDLTATNGVVHVIDAVITPVTSIFDVVANSPEHTILQSLLEITELDDDISDATELTLFAPPDAVFESLPMDVINYLTADPAGFLSRILLNHAFAGAVGSADLQIGTFITSLAGKRNPVVVDTDEVLVGFDEVEVVLTDLEGPNGLIHVVDDIIFPYDITVDETIELDDRLTSLNSATEASMLDAALADLGSGNSYTVFAPTNNAFGELDQEVLDILFANPTDLLADILEFHVVPDYLLDYDFEDGDELETLNGELLTITKNNDGTFINGARIIDKDYISLNGTVHLIDKVLFPPNPVTVFDIIANSDVHETLEAAIVAADLDETLSGDGPFTVLAPTDAAFNLLGQATIDALLADIPQLTNILTYHVLAGEAFSGDLVNGPITMLSGEDVVVNVDNGVVFNGTAMVILADIPGVNGVVHAIDAVLLPASVATDNLLPVDYKFEVYPIPAASFLNIEIENDANQTNRIVELFDLTGKLIVSQNRIGNKTQLNVGDLANGQYYIRLTTSEGSAIRKIQILK